MRVLFVGLLLCGALVHATAHAQSTATPSTPSAPPSTAAPAPDTPAKDVSPATPPPAPGSTPIATSASPSIVPDTSASPLERLTWDQLIQDVKATDIAIAFFAVVVAFFALLVALFALRVGSAIKRVGAAGGNSEDNRRAIEAAERAAEAARRSAEAAEQTLSTMRDPAERQLRAYVTVKQFLQAPAKDDRENMNGWWLQVVWQNGGATPTQAFRYWAMVREFDSVIPDDFEFTPEGLKDFAAGELSSGATINSPPLFISPETIAAIQDGSRKVLLLGQADYNDVLGNNVRRETRFCVEVAVMRDPGGASGSPFSFIYHPQHNYIT